MKYLVGIIFLSTHLLLGAQTLVCAFDLRDKSKCDIIRELCERVFKLDSQKQLVFVASGVPRDSFRVMRTRAWTELRIEAVEENTVSLKDKEGGVIYATSRVVIFDRTSGSITEFDEHKDKYGLIMDSDAINRINSEVGRMGGFFASKIGQNRLNGACKIQERLF